MQVEFHFFCFLLLQVQELSASKISWSLLLLLTNQILV
jgi:hypothetical protein